jgi:hypothetical protein
VLSDGLFRGQFHNAGLTSTSPQIQPTTSRATCGNGSWPSRALSPRRPSHSIPVSSGTHTGVIESGTVAVGRGEQAGRSDQAERAAQAEQAEQAEQGA